jgi:ATP-dependent Clp protease ATP-binding subunit ClpB
LIKPSLARGKLRCIGATTPDEYRQYIEKDVSWIVLIAMVFFDDVY